MNTRISMTQTIVAHECKVKMKIIQEMIQIERPNGWNIDRINLISKEINKIELYNKIKYR